jgi:penicillin-binding protein 2
MKKAIAESCDVYFYTIGGGFGKQIGLGPSRIKKYLEYFGWSKKTGIDLPGENDGFIPSPEWKSAKKKEPWYDGDTYNLSIGQGDVLITPIQVANSTVALANGGTLYKPQIVKETIGSDKNIIKEFAPQIIGVNFINPEYLKIAREGMRQAVTGENSPQASSVTLNSLPVKVAAKTGTAQTSRVNYYHNWITVFAPYDDPQIVLTIVFENVKNLQAAALPAAKNILGWYFSGNNDKINE